MNNPDPVSKQHNERGEVDLQIVADANKLFLKFQSDVDKLLVKFEADVKLLLENFPELNATPAQVDVFINQNQSRWKEILERVMKM